VRSNFAVTPIRRYARAPFFCSRRGISPVALLPLLGAGGHHHLAAVTERGGQHTGTPVCFSIPRCGARCLHNAPPLLPVSRLWNDTSGGRIYLSGLEPARVLQQGRHQWPPGDHPRPGAWHPCVVAGVYPVIHRPASPPSRASRSGRPPPDRPALIVSARRVLRPLVGRFCPATSIHGRERSPPWRCALLRPRPCPAALFFDSLRPPVVREPLFWLSGLHAPFKALPPHTHRHQLSSAPHGQDFSVIHAPSPLNLAPDRTLGVGYRHDKWVLPVEAQSAKEWGNGAGSPAMVSGHPSLNKTAILSVIVGTRPRISWWQRITPHHHGSIWNPMRRFGFSSGDMSSRIASKNTLN